MKPFTDIKLSPEMVENLNKLKYVEMTPVQEKAIPLILDGKDFLAQAKTGSGKTAAFGIGLLERLDVELFRVQALILCPTRELAEQVSGELRRLARFRHNIKILNITGGMPVRTQEQSLFHQAHIVVGTPGRIEKLLQRETLILDDVKTVVLDEADRMLDMGFIDIIYDIIDFAPMDRQTLCFSATFPDEIKTLSKELMIDPQELVVESLHSESVINQHFYEVPANDRAKATVTLFRDFKPESAVVFCNTKDGCRRVQKELNRFGLHTLALHGDLEQKERNEVLVRFSNGSSRVLVATDVAARGLDIDDLGAVINYDLPFETEIYIHRIGRTGRAGKEGMAFSFVVPGEQFRLDKINEMVHGNFNAESLDCKINNDFVGEPAKMETLSINGGRKNKIGPGDILGALTAPGGIPGKVIGKIDRMDNITFVAVERDYSSQAMNILTDGPIKGRSFKSRIHRDT